MGAPQGAALMPSTLVVDTGVTPERLFGAEGEARLTQPAHCVAGLAAVLH
jgi:hypothetical protein